MADSAEQTLPDFHNPPVVETVLSAQFEKLEGMSAVHFGLFWERVRDQFPQTQEHPALDPVIEPFDVKLQNPPRILFLPQGVPFAQRVWLINTAGGEMMQIQNDRFIKNWRKADDDDQYPHYDPVIRPGFDRDFALFKQFLADEGIDSPKINQCEVTYVNHIVSGEGWDDLSEADKIFTFWKSSNAQYPGRATELILHSRFVIRDESEKPIGRLHVDVSPAVRASDGKPMYVMNLTARGLYGDGIAFFDIGRSWIVNSFKHLTTEHMHRIWKEK